MKKLLLFISVGLFFLQVFCYSAPTVDTQIAIGNRQNPLTSATTAAFSIYLTSVNATGTTTGSFKMYASSFTLEQLNTGGGASTHTFNVLLSTSDTIFDIINRANEITNWTFTISPGCYGLQFATGSASVRDDNEGKTFGLQYDATGKAVTISTGSANAVTIYFNNTITISDYFEPSYDKRYEVYDINTSLATGTTMYLYEGVKSSGTDTLLAIPNYNTGERQYPNCGPLLSSFSDYALEFRVVFSTFVDTVNDKIQIFLNSR